MDEVDHEAGLTSILANDQESTRSRVEAACKLAHGVAPASLMTLLAVASDERADPELLSAVGTSAARRCFRMRGDLDDMAFANLTEEAFIAYDQEFASLMKSAPDIEISYRSVSAS